MMLSTYLSFPLFFSGVGFSFNIFCGGAEFPLKRELWPFQTHLSHFISFAFAPIITMSRFLHSPVNMEVPVCVRPMFFKTSTGCLKRHHKACFSPHRLGQVRLDLTFKKIEGVREE